MLFIFGMVAGIVLAFFGLFVWDFSSGWIKPDKPKKDNTSKFPTSR